MPTVFVSYARSDQPTVQTLVSELRELGYDAFFDQNLTGGQPWWDVLLDRIQASDGFLPVLSEEYRQSEACHREAKWAESLNLPFVPIDLGEVGPELCEPVVAQANWVRYRLDDRASLLHLSRALAAMRKPEPPVPLPERPPIPISYFAELEREIRTSATLSLERQLVIIATLRGKLGTRENAAARTMLAELRKRDDITWQNAVEIDGLLGSSAARAATPPPPTPGDQQTYQAAYRQPHAQYEQSYQPQYQQTSQTPYQAPYQAPDQRQQTAAPGRDTRINPLALVVWGIGAVLAVVALAGASWISGGGSSVDFSEIHDGLQSSSNPPGFSSAYFGGLGYVLVVLTAAVSIATVFLARIRIVAMIVVVVLSVISVLMTIGATAAVTSWLHDNGTSVDTAFGLWLCVFGFLFFLMTSVVPRRRKA